MAGGSVSLGDAPLAGTARDAYNLALREAIATADKGLIDLLVKRGAKFFSDFCRDPEYACRFTSPEAVNLADQVGWRPSTTGFEIDWHVRKKNYDIARAMLNLLKGDFYQHDTYGEVVRHLARAAEHYLTIDDDAYRFYKSLPK